MGDDMDDMDGGYGNKGDMDMCMSGGKPEGEYGYDKPEGEMGSGMMGNKPEWGSGMMGDKPEMGSGMMGGKPEGEMGYGNKDYGNKGGKKEKHDHCDVCAVSCMTHGKTQVEVEIMNYIMMGNN